MHHRYTTQSLSAEDDRFIARSPGVREVVRFFPEPSSIGRGSLGVEGGITLVGGPGLGKTSLLRRLERALQAERRIPTAFICLPRPEGEGEPFYRFLAALVQGAREGLLGSPLLGEPSHAAIREVLAREPTWDGGAAPPGLTPRGLADWVATLGAAATRSGGICLLVDDVDQAADAAWRGAFVAALRFTFQAAAGVTPIYGAWRLFLDESLPGSNYFRNVTRPVFLEPLGREARAGEAMSERAALVELGLPGLAPPARERLFELAGGHPQLLHRMLADVGARLESGAQVGLDAPGLDAHAEVERAGQESLVKSLLAGSPALEAPLRQLEAARSGQPYVYQDLPKAVVATGLVDSGADGLARLPVRVARYLARGG